MLHNELVSCREIQQAHTTGASYDELKALAVERQVRASRSFFKSIVRRQRTGSPLYIGSLP